MEPQDPQGQTPLVVKENGNKFAKVALIVFFIILLIVVGEVGFYAYNQYFKPQGQTTASPSPTVFFEEPPLGGPTDRFLEGSKTYNFEKLDSIVAQLNSSLTLKSEFVKELTFNITFAGKVVDAREVGFERDGFFMTYQIQFHDDKSGKDLSYSFPATEESSAEVGLKTPEGIQKISVRDIKIGDYVVLKQESNLLDSSPNSTLILEVTRP